MLLHCNVSGTCPPALALDCTAICYIGLQCTITSSNQSNKLKCTCTLPYDKFWSSLVRTAHGPLCTSAVNPLALMPTFESGGAHFVSLLNPTLLSSYSITLSSSSCFDANIEGWCGSCFWVSQKIITLIILCLY